MEIREFNVPDYGILKVSEYGDVWGVHDYSKKRVLSVDKDGYYRLAIKYRQKHIDENGIERQYRTFFVHRLVAMCFLDNPNNYPVVNHKDGNKQNNHYTNLEWCTVRYNNLHAIKNHLYKGYTGENNPHCKLQEQDVLDIRERYEKSCKQGIKGYKFYDSICTEYGVDRETIRHICKRITWKNI